MKKKTKMRKFKSQLRKLKHQKPINGWGLLVFMLSEYLGITKDGKLQLGN